MFGTVKLDLETQRQMTVQAIQEKIDEGKMTDTEEDFWDEVVEEVEVMVLKYNIDTAQTVVNWRGYEETGVENPEYHEGTATALEGTVEITETNGVIEITDATFSVDMNSIKESNDVAKLEAHLRTPDFFNVNEFASTTFNFEKHEEGMLYGKVNIIGTDLNIVAPVSVEKGDDMVTITVESFRIDVTPANLPFFVAELEMEEGPDKHDPVLEFNLVVVAK